MLACLHFKFTKVIQLLFLHLLYLECFQQLYHRFGLSSAPLSEVCRLFHVLSQNSPKLPHSTSQEPWGKCCIGGGRLHCAHCETHPCSNSSGIFTENKTQLWITVCVMRCQHHERKWMLSWSYGLVPGSRATLSLTGWAMQKCTFQSTVNHFDWFG